MYNTEARVYFYDIVQAGYYSRGSDAPAFGGVGDACSRLHEWVRRGNKRLSETATYEPGENSRITKAYCAGVERDSATGDFLITMWNAAETIGGDSVASISDSPVGQSKVFETRVPPGSIPGYPAYFWVFPREGMYASVQFGSGRNGRGEFDYYLKSFLSKFTAHAMYDGADTPEYFAEVADRTILGYRDADENTPTSGIISPRWKANRRQSEGSIQRIRDGRDRIRKVVRKNSLDTTVQVGKNIFHRFLEFIRGPRQGDQSWDGAERLHIKLEMDFTPTTEELDAIIEDWTYHEEQGSRWNDAGFVMEGVGQPLWLSHSYPKGTLHLDFAQEPSILIDSRTLLSALSAKRGSALQAAG